jgi:hypothetical protein
MAELAVSDGIKEYHKQKKETLFFVFVVSNSRLTPYLPLQKNKYCRKIF